MTDEKPYGLALIVGPLASLVTMAFHPTGHALLGNFERVAPINRGVHALAIAGVIMTFYGLVGVHRALASRRALGDAALVSYGFGAIAVMFAAIASGFIGTMVADWMLHGGDGARAVWAPVMDYNSALNQSTTKVYVVAASLGIALFSWAMLNLPRFGKALGMTGIVIGIAAIVATVAGLRMDIHGFGAIVLGHGTWIVWTGARLVRPAA